MKGDAVAVSGPAAAVEDVVYLVDQLATAIVDAPAENYIGVHRVVLRRENRTAIFQHPSSRIEFQPVFLGHDPKLRFACGIKQNAWDKVQSKVVFEIFAKGSSSNPKRIFRRVLAPHLHARDRRWIDEMVDLSAFHHQSISLILSVSTPRGGRTDYCWSAWGDPQILHRLPKPQKTSPFRKLGHIILITADALRPDFLGCYGGSSVRTPNCDQLAADGTLFLHARAQASSTLSSHASLMCGRSPLAHGISAEWGAFPRDMLSLPKYLAEHGFHTILVPSERELTDPRAGIAPLFQKTAPCLGDPAQDGSLTTRIALDLIRAQETPTFFWIEYFDTHPPVIPPEPYRSMYYHGDPSDPKRLQRPEAVGKIRGVELMQELCYGLPLLEQGRVDGNLLAKLEATVAAFRGSNSSYCDLALHLQNLGPRAYGSMPREDFAAWLALQIQQIRDERSAPELVAWLKALIPLLEQIERDITSWLDGVVDFRFPVAQYASAISYFDSQVGTLLSFLKQTGSYDESTVIVASPHGEILDEHGIHFHHHTLTESCLRVPMIIKPSSSRQVFGAGSRIDGVFDSIDLFPTLVDLLGLPQPMGLEGLSRGAHVRNASPIMDHDSFAINNSYTMSCVTRLPYKFIKVGHEHITSPQWDWHTGDTALYDLRADTPDSTNHIDDLPQIAAQMEQRLDQFLGRELDAR